MTEIHREDEGTITDDAGIMPDESGYLLPTTTNTNDDVTVHEQKPFVVSGEVNVNTAVPQGLPQWLLRTFDFYGRKQTYEIHAWNWEGEYPNLWQLVQDASKIGIINSRSTPDPDPRYPDGTPNEHYIILKPTTWERLKQAVRQKPGPKTNLRQISVDDEKFDVRSGRVFMLLRARAQDLENIAYSFLHQLRTTEVEKVRRRMRGELKDMLLLRGSDLPRPLYDTINLRLRGQITNVADGVLGEPDVSAGDTWEAKVTFEAWI